MLNSDPGLDKELSRDPQSSGRAGFLSDSSLGTGALTNSLGCADPPEGSAQGWIPWIALCCGPHRPCPLTPSF